MYRSPSFPSIQFADYLEETLVKVNNEHKFCIIGGDFNIDILKHHIDDTCSNFVNLLSSMGFFPCICLPTRITSHSATLIDNFFCNDLSYITSPAVITHDISDHLPISIHIKTSNDSKKTSVRHNQSFDFRNIDKLKQSLAIKLSGFFHIRDAEIACSFLTDSLRDEMSHYSTKKVSRRSVPFQPWISYGLLRCINRKNYLHKKFLHSPTKTNQNAFKIYRNTLNKLIRSAKTQYFKRRLNENKSDSKKLWEILLTMIRKRKPSEDLPSHFVVEGMNVDQPEVISNQFNTFFCSVATNLEASIPQSTTDPLSYLRDSPPSNLFHFHPTNNDTVYHLIQNLNNCGAGHDGISTKISKLICPDIVPYLTHTFNLCLAQGIFPSCFKKAIVVPIFKSGNRFLFNNYRPIVLLPILSKVLEKIAYDQLSSYLAEEELLCPNQFGFRKNHSTSMPISLLYEHVTNELKKKQVCAAVYLDLSKAFDTVNPDILLKKLNLYGIQNKMLDFFHSYLTGRCQILKYNSVSFSSPKHNTLGVRQGSILGPLLFLLYINDIHHSSSTPQFLLYADDTAILFSAPSVNQLQVSINSSLPSVATWLNSNRLTLNVKKSTYQLFSIKSPLPDININIGSSLFSRSKSFMYLGITIDENLKWSSHIKHVENTISRNVGLVGRSQYMLDSNYLLMLYSVQCLDTPFSKLLSTSLG